MAIDHKNTLKKCFSWADFVAQVEQLQTTKSVGDRFELLTKLHLLSAPEHRTKFKSVWSLAEVPRSVARKLNLPARDEGIDLIAVTFSGQYWAVQCKYRSAYDAALGVKALSTFSNLAFQHCTGISNGLIAHTSNKPIRKKNLLGPVTELGLSNWLRLDDEAWKGIHALIGSKPIKLKPRKPRRHQREAITAATKHFKTASRGLMIMPCGSGKSLTAFWIARELAAKTVVVAVPSLALIKQSIKDWTREYLANGIEPEWLAVCSDESVGDVSKDEFVSSVYELGIEVTTSKSGIVEFLNKRRSGKPKVIYVTYQSGIVLSEAVLAAQKKADLIICDEAHKTVGDEDKQFSTLLADGNLPAKKRLFMTATDRVATGSDKREKIYSMDDPDAYGRVFHQLSFKRAVERGLISDYKILTVSVSSAEIDELIQSNKFLRNAKDKGEQYNASALAAGIALDRTFDDWGVRHAISFHRSINEAEEFARQRDALANIGVVKSDVLNRSISSKKSAADRDDLLREFAEADKAIMANARCLTEGVDIPSIDCVCFASPKQSVVDIVQAAGRAMRKHEGKDFGYVLLPIIVPEGMDFEEYCETTAFKTVARTIAALSTQDERIVDYFRLKENSKIPSEKIIEFESVEVLGAKIDFKKFADAIETKIWERVAKVNWLPFQEARDFVHSLQLKSRQEWDAYVRSKDRRPDIPTHPWSVYKDSGYSDLGDWLGTFVIATFDMEFLPFEEARAFVHSLSLASVADWKEYCMSGKRPADIPANPRQTYTNSGWRSMGDWLGTGAIATQDRHYRPFKEARKFARALGLKSQADWGRYITSNELPDDIPSDPRSVYLGDGWVGIGDWLGTGNISPAAKKLLYKPFPECLKFARGLKLNSGAEWREYVKSGAKPEYIPAYPATTFKDDGWQGWGHWLGTGRSAPGDRRFLPFPEARDFARSLKLTSKNEWAKYASSDQRPANIPALPSRSYKNEGWDGWGDWLGTGVTATFERKYLPFNKARKFARDSDLNSQREWFAASAAGRLPKEIPTHPERVYKEDGWLNWGDWFGTSNHKGAWRAFGEARKFARSLQLENSNQWRVYCGTGERPSDIPASPDKAYAGKGWKGFPDWLGYR